MAHFSDAMVQDRAWEDMDMAWTWDGHRRALRVEQDDSALLFQCLPALRSSAKRLSDSLLYFPVLLVWAACC